MIEKEFFNYLGQLSVADIIKLTGCKVAIKGKILSSNDSEYKNISGLKFQSVAAIDDAKDKDITFLHSARYADKLIDSNAGACFIAEKLIDRAPDNMVLFVSDSPRRAFAIVCSAFYAYKRPKLGYIAESSHIDSSATIGDDVHIGENVVIKANVTIGKGSIIEDNSVIYENVVIGENCNICSNASIMYAKIGNNVTIGHGTRVGQRGFGFDMDENGYIDVPQLGLAIIEDNVRIGSNCIIDRGALKNTVIGKNTQIADLVQIAHNVEVGRNSIIVSQTGIAGSTKVGNFVMIGGQVGINGHIEIGDGAKIAGGSGVIQSIKPGESVGGYPAMPIMKWHRLSAMLNKFMKK